MSGHKGSRVFWAFSGLDSIFQAKHRGKEGQGEKSGKGREKALFLRYPLIFSVAMAAESRCEERFGMCLKSRAQNCEKVPAKHHLESEHGFNLSYSRGRLGAFFKLFVSLFVLEFKAFRGTFVLQRCKLTALLNKPPTSSTPHLRHFRS